MATAASLIVALEARTAQFTAEMKRAELTLTSFGKTVKGVSKVTTLIAGGGVIAGLTMMAKRLASLSEALTDIQVKAATGAISQEEATIAWYKELYHAIPVVGDLTLAVNDLWGALDGSSAAAARSAAETAKIDKAAQAIGQIKNMRNTIADLNAEVALMQAPEEAKPQLKNEQDRTKALRDLEKMRDVVAKMPDWGMFGGESIKSAGLAALQGLIDATNKLYDAKAKVLEQEAAQKAADEAAEKRNQSLADRAQAIQDITDKTRNLLMTERERAEADADKLDLTDDQRTRYLEARGNYERTKKAIDDITDAIERQRQMEIDTNEVALEGLQDRLDALKALADPASIGFNATERGSVEAYQAERAASPMFANMRSENAKQVAKLEELIRVQREALNVARDEAKKPINVVTFN